KRSDGAPNSQAVASRASDFPESELRGGACGPARKRAIRLRSRRFYRRDPCEAGQVRTVQQGNDPARRNRRNAAVTTGQAAARSSGPAVLAPGQPIRGESGRSYPGGDQHQYSRGVGEQAASRGPLLSLERLHPSHSPTTRTQGRDSDPAEAFHDAVVWTVCAFAAAVHAGPDAGLPELQLAGQFA